METKTFDIGGVFDLTLARSDSGYIGEYCKKGSRTVYMFDGSGMTKKQILKKFWGLAKKVS